MKKILLAIAFLCALPAGAQTITAAGCTSTQVQAAFNSVVAGTTTVIIPACASTAWTTTVTLTVPSGSSTLTVQGSSTTTGTCAPGGTCTPTDATTLTDNLTRGGGGCGTDPAFLQINTGSATSIFRLTGITFGFTGQQTCSGSVRIAGNSQNIRIDHNHFNQQFSTGVGMNGYTLGVFDHNFFEAPSGVWNAIKFEEGNWTGETLGVGDHSWNTATQFGTNQLFYVENNEFHSAFPGSTSYANDCTSGGRYAWRFNLEVNTMHQTHPTGGGQRHRGCRAVEIYKNAETGTGGAGANFNFYFLSSGASLIWGNTTDNTYSNFITIHSDRRDTITYQQSPTPTGWGYCGTSFNGTGSNWDQNTNTSTGYRCLDQPGQGVGQLLINDFPNVLNNSTGTIAWPNEALEPVYEWLDTSTATTFLSNYETDALFPNSDYYLYTGSFTGATGTGSGTLAARPSTCTSGVAYWATDQGSWNQSGNGSGNGVLYKCGAGNAWTSFYTPYTYPNPLVSGASATPGFVSESGKNSTLTVALGASGGSGIIPTSTCASFSYCIPFAENALTGNLGIAAFQYANASAVTSTVTDDHSNTWTCIGSSAASGTKFLNLCYTPNLVAGTHKVTLTFGTTAVTQVQADVAQFFNIATSAPLRTSSSIVGTSSTTMTGPALTTSAGDLTYAMFCRTGTPLMTSGAFTPGSGWTLGLTKYQDGCATEWQVSAGGSITPAMTMGSASTYIVYAADFIPSSSPAGTAPTSPYLQRVMSWSSQSGVSASSTKFQLPNSAGDLLVMMGAGAANYLGNSITDSGSNSWTLAGQCQQTGSCSSSGGYSYEFYSLNAAANSTNTQTVNFTGSGDTTSFFYDFVGTFTFSTRGQFSSNANTTNALPATAFSFSPGVTNALTIAIGPIAFNTAQAVSQPATGTNYFDGGWFGGETINGGSVPESIIDQNNIFSHTYQTGISGAQNWQWNTALSSSEANNVGADLISFSTSLSSGSVTFAPTSLAFGTVPQGTTSSGMTSTIANTTGSTITYSSLALSGTNSADFTRSATTCGSFSGGTLLNGASCTVTYTFSPTAAPGTNEVATATLTFTGGGTSPITLALSGTSGNNAAVTFTPAGTLTFGNQVPNTTSASQTITVTSSGTGNLILAASNAVTMTGTNAAQFAITGNTCTNGLTITPTNTCVITLTFTPNASGVFVAQINLTSNAPASPNVELLAGTGATTAPVPTMFTQVITPGSRMATVCKPIAGESAICCAGDGCGFSANGAPFKKFLTSVVLSPGVLPSMTSQ